MEGSRGGREEHSMEGSKDCRRACWPSVGIEKGIGTGKISS